MYIYKIINSVNNFCYIGQSKTPKKRFKEHIRLLKNNSHDNNYLQKAFNKYKQKAFYFELVECLISCDQIYLNEREEWWINNTCNIYNIHKTVTEIFYPRCNLNNGFKGKKHSLESKNKMSKAVKEWHKYNDNPNLGKRMSNDQKKLLSLKAKERLKDSKNNPSYVKQQFTFIKGEEVFIGTPYDFFNYLQEKHLKPDRSSITKLTKGTIKTHQGFKIL